MRKILWGLLAVALGACSSYAQSVIAVQSAGTGLETSESSISLAFSQNTTAGNTIIVAVDSGTPVTQLTDALGNNYVKDLGPIGARSYIFRASNIAGGPDTVTAVFAGSNRGSSIHMVEYSGLALSSPFDGGSGANGHNTAVDCANVTTHNPHDLLIAYARVRFTLQSTDSNYAATDTAFDNWMGERRVSGAGTYTASFTQEPGGTFECLLAAYKIGSGDGGDGNPLQITTATVPSGIVNLPYTTTLLARGGTPPYTWSVTSDSLPPGLTLSASTGSIAGAPTQVGDYSFTVQVRDSAAPRHSATRAWDLTIAGSQSQLQITNNALPAGTVAMNYGATLAATGGVPPYRWTISGGQLPPGLALQASTGHISGTPTQSGAFTLLIQVGDSSAQTASNGFNINVSPTSDSAPSSLLAAMTPANFTVPAGWTLVRAQDFESGTLPSDQFMDVGSSITTNNPHTGTRSLQGPYLRDADSVRWGLNGGVTGSFSELYVSFYDYIESQARFNDEFGMTRFEVRNSQGVLEQEVIVDNFGYGAFNSTSTTMVFVPQTNTNGLNGSFVKRGYEAGLGTWIQWETHYKPNSPGENDGFIRVYRNGALFTEEVNVNLNASINMNGAMIEVGGLYTKLTWIKDGGGCGTFIGDGTDNGPRVTDFSKTCPCPNQCPPSGTAPIFNRYIDDIIVLKK